MTNIHVCASIQYTNSENQPVHSDICQEYRTNDSKITDENRELMHKFLDEYLDLTPKQQEEGTFIIGTPGDAVLDFEEFFFGGER